MMLIVADKDPYKNAKYIAEHTNKNFLFKSLLELGQLICSCGISSVYKPVKRRMRYRTGYFKISYGCTGTIGVYGIIV